DGDHGGTRVVPGHPRDGARGRPAIGAMVTVHLPDGRVRVAHVDGGSGHSGKSSPEIHMGLGALAPDAELAVTVAWRTTAGKVASTALRVTPGWHTVVLGAPSADAALRGPATEDMR